jgi:hypothetical protein
MLPSGQTFGVQYSCLDGDGMVYYTTSRTPRTQENNEFSYAYADNRLSSIKKLDSTDYWGAAGKTVGVVGILGAVAYTAMSGDITAFQKAWEFEFGVR